MSELSPKRQGEGGFSLLLVVFSTTAFWQSYAISGFTGLATAGVFPMLASATMIVAALCILFQSMSRPNSTRFDASNLDASDTQGFVQSVLPKRLIVVVMLITGYVMAMPVLGFMLSSAGFLFLSFSYLWRKSLVVSIVVTLASVISVYLIFRKLFQVVLPKGSWLQGLFWG